MSDWRPIAEVAEISPETLGAKTEPDYLFRYIDLGSVENGHVYWDSLQEYRFSDAPSRARRKVRPGDVLFGTVRPNLRSHGYVSERQSGELVASTGFSVIRPREQVSNGKYLFFAVLGHEIYAQSVNAAVGSNYPAVSDRDVRQFRIFAPPVREQEQIAQILDTLDTQIRQTEALIAKLERIKQGLLTDLLTRGIDQNGQLRPAPDQAPHLYKDSPLGRVPRHWEVASLGGHLQGSPKNGYSPQEAGSFTGRMMLGLGCLTPSGFKATQLKHAPRHDPLVDRTLLRNGDLLMTRANTRELVGLVGIYRDIGCPCSYPDLIMKLTPAASTSEEFLELVLSSPSLRKQVQGAASGTSGSMVKISGAIVKQLLVAMPERDEQRRISAAAGEIRKRIEAETESLRIAREMKQGLMNDLLTGCVRVTPLLEAAGRMTA